MTGLKVAKFSWAMWKKNEISRWNRQVKAVITPGGFSVGDRIGAVIAEEGEPLCGTKLVPASYIKEAGQPPTKVVVRLTQKQV